MTGKGGAGKSTVAAALGLAAAGRGRRTIVVEVAGQAAIARRFGLASPGSGEAALAPNLSTLSIEPERAQREYLRMRAGRVGGALASSRVFGYFAAAAPGLAELVTIGKAWELTRSGYDLVVVDAPSSGHGAALLRAPKTFTDIARVGPVARDAKAIQRTLADRRRCGLVLVALPEQLSVNETVALRHQLRRDPGIAVDAVVANAVYPRRFGERVSKQLRRALEDDLGLQTSTAVRAALSERERRRWQEEQLSRLAAGLGFDALEVPYQFTPEPDIERIAALLGRSL